MMKKINKYLLFFIFGIIMFSCEDEWLDTKPLSIFTPESVYIDKAGLEAELLTCRKKLRPEFYGGPGAIACEYVCTDVAISGTKSTGGAHDYVTQLTPTGYPSDFWAFKWYWNNAYNTLKDANLVISRIDDVDWKSEQDRNEILAEGYFHRAYWYYRLVHQYGDVPFLNKEYTAPKLNFYSHSRKTILAKIQSDLEFAVQWLPDNVKYGKVSRAAGNHLLAKVCLANSDFDKAVEAASQVIDGSSHNLMTQRFGISKTNSKLNVIWDLHQKENKSIAANTEGILIVQDKYEFPTTSVSGGTKTMRTYTPAWPSNRIKDPDGKRGCVDTPINGLANPAIAQFGRGVGYVRPTGYYETEIWENAGNDLRCDQDTNWVTPSKLWYNNPASNYYGQPVDLKYTPAIDTFQAAFSWPHYKVFIYDEEVKDKPFGGHSDWYVFRLAETYLLRAEAYYWKGNLASAALDINKVRDRSLAPPISPSQVTIEYILDERARELYAEEPRKTELTRISFIMADNNLNGYSLDNFSQESYWYDRIEDKNNFYNVGIVYGTLEFRIRPYHVLWPIPQDAIDSNTGGRINQNEGYPGAENNIPPKTEITAED